VSTLNKQLGRGLQLVSLSPDIKGIRWTWRERQYFEVLCFLKELLIKGYFFPSPLHPLICLTGIFPDDVSLSIHA
jgi:hypothetical protein